MNQERTPELTLTRDTTHPVFGGVTFTRHCNNELRPRPIYGMLTHDFEACMDACAIWSMWCPDNFGPHINSTCTGVRFVPAWTDRNLAYNHSARGNCFIHSSVGMADLKKPELPGDVTCHSALVVSVDGS